MRKNFKTKQITVLIFALFLLSVFLFPLKASAAVTTYISDEAGGNNQIGQDAADALDNTWMDSVSSIYTCNSSNSTNVARANIPATLDTANLMSANGVTVSVSLQNATDSTVGVANGTNFSSFASTTTLQDGAPMPSSLTSSGYYANETGGLGSSRNGALFTFSSPVRAFGAWFGDLETRTPDAYGSVRAYVRYFDASMNQIGSDIEVMNSIDESQCGSVNSSNAFTGCGNKTTRWIGFSADASTPVKYMLVVVGDDDTTNPASPYQVSDISTTNGNTESISFVGPTLVTANACASSSSTSNTSSASSNSSSLSTSSSSISSVASQTSSVNSSTSLASSSATASNSMTSSVVSSTSTSLVSSSVSSSSLSMNSGTSTSNQNVTLDSLLTNLNIENNFGIVNFTNINGDVNTTTINNYGCGCGSTNCPNPQPCSCSSSSSTVSSLSSSSSSVSSSVNSSVSSSVASTSSVISSSVSSSVSSSMSSVSTSVSTVSSNSSMSSSANSTTASATSTSSAASSVSSCTNQSGCGSTTNITNITNITYVNGDINNYIYNYFACGGGCSSSSNSSLTSSPASSSSATSSISSSSVSSTAISSTNSLSTSVSSISSSTSSTVSSSVSSVSSSLASTNSTSLSSAQSSSSPVCLSTNLHLVKSHTGNFTVGQNGSFTLSLSNYGSNVAKAPLTINDTLPIGMQLVSYTGTNWNCASVGQNVTCIRNTDLATNENSQVVLTVSVSNQTLSKSTNVASAYFACAETDPVDNMASDSVITQAPAVLGASTGSVQGLATTGADMSRFILSGLSFVTVATALLRKQRK